MSACISLRSPSASRLPQLCPSTRTFLPPSRLLPRSAISACGSKQCAWLAARAQSRAEMPDQLVFPFGVKHALGRDDFIAAPCNEHALRFIERWPDWPARAAAIFGPAQSGKTHLAEIWCARTSAKRLSGAGLMLDALGISGDAALALELTETHLPDVERDRLLLALLDRPKGFLLLTAREPPSEWIVSV